MFLYYLQENYDYHVGLLNNHKKYETIKKVLVSVVSVAAQGHKGDRVWLAIKALEFVTLVVYAKSGWKSNHKLCLIFLSICVCSFHFYR